MIEAVILEVELTKEMDLGPVLPYSTTPARRWRPSEAAP